MVDISPTYIGFDGLGTFEESGEGEGDDQPSLDPTERANVAASHQRGFFPLNEKIHLRKSRHKNFPSCYDKIRADKIGGEN